MEQFCNLDEEVRNGYLISKEMKHVWNIQLNMMVKLINVCEKYKLKLYASSGTLLGAIRHKGYIPWDDDIDVEMLRDDYDKLLKVAQYEFEKPFFFQSPYTEKGYFRGHSQIRYEGTTAIIPQELKTGKKFNQGIFIDIFVMDGVPSDRNVLSKEIKFRRNIINFLWKRYYPKSYINVFSIIKSFIRLGRKSFMTDIKLYSDFENSLRKHVVSESGVIAPLSFSPHDKTLYMNLEWYSDVKMVPFEKIEIPIPIGYHKILERMYGDYLKPVQSPTMHGNLIFDVNKSYKEYLNNEPSMFVYVLTLIIDKIKKIYR